MSEAAIEEQGWWERCAFSQLTGKILAKAECADDMSEIRLETTEGTRYCMYHEQDCCESVLVEDICGDLEDLIGSEIVLAEVSRSTRGDGDHQTWTFYHLRTAKGVVTIRWYGISNGYYSEEVDFEVFKEGGDV